MQKLTGGVRSELTDAQVTELLVGDDVSVSAGLEKVDINGKVIADLTDDLLAGEVARNNYADVHGTCNLNLSRKLLWGVDRVRPFMVLSSSEVSARFDLGVFVLTTPDRPIGEELETYEVSGFDLLYILQSLIGDTYVVSAGTTYLQAVKDVLTASGAGTQILLDGTLQDTTLPGPMVWCLDESDQVSWLRVINDLLGAINYRGLWVDEQGRFRSEPYQNPATRPYEWTFVTEEGSQSIVSEDRTEKNDLWGAPNWWRFVRRDMSTKPVEGDGIYTVINQSDGPSSVNSMGREIRAETQFLDAADQASLVAQGNRIVATDRAISRTIQCGTAPFPIAGHFDVAVIRDAKLGGTVKVQAQSWSLPLDGTDMTWVWEAV